MYGASSHAPDKTKKANHDNYVMRQLNTLWLVTLTQFGNFACSSNAFSQTGRGSFGLRDLSVETPSKRHDHLFFPLCLGARCAPMTAPSALEVTDALASCRVLTRLLACLQGRNFASRAVQVNFTGTAVAYKFGTDLDPTTWRDFHAKRHSHPLVPFCLGAQRTPVAAIFAVKVTDTLASFRVFTRVHAYLQAWNFASRAVQVNFTGTAVAYKFVTDFDPGTRLSFHPKRRSHLFFPFRLSAKRSPVRAPFALVVRDAGASFRDLA